MNIQRKIFIPLFICLCVLLSILGIILYTEFTTPVGITSNMYAAATMDLQIYLSDEIVLAKVVSENESKTINRTLTTEKGKKIIKELVTDTELQILDVYKGSLTSGNKVTHRGNYGNLKGLENINLSDNPNFKLGEEYILFLQKDDITNTYSLTAGVQSKFVYDSTNNKYVGKHILFEDIKAEIERYNNTPEDQRDLLGAGKGSIDDI